MSDRPASAPPTKLKLYSLNHYAPHYSIDILVWARNPEEAVKYLKTLPTTWHCNLSVDRFKEVKLPKSNKPQILTCHSRNHEYD